MRAASITALFAGAAWPATATYIVGTGTPSDDNGASIDSGQRVAGRLTLAADALITSAEGMVAGNVGVGMLSASQSAIPEPPAAR